MAVDLNRDGLLIGGAWRPGAGGRLRVENPSTGVCVGDIAAADAGDVDAAVAAARAALSGDWGRLSAADRGRLLARLAVRVADHAEPLARIEAQDVGKPLRQARADVTALARYLEFYAGAADKILGETIPYLPGYTVHTRREPHGVTGHIIPWNYPLQIIGRSVVAALTMGNAAVLKPAEDASRSALAFAALAEDAGLPAGALNVVTGLGETAGAALAAHPGINHLSFTGSGPVGAMIQAAAGKNGVGVTLELGGKSPQLVFDDADLEKALPALISAAIQNAGQTCSAASRILVHRRVHDQIVASLAERFAGLVAGPAEADLDLGPLISAKQRTRVLAFLAQGRADLTTAAEGRVADDAPSGGHYVAPVLFTGVPADHPLFQEEIFGPIALVTAFDDEAHAVALANATRYGLVAGVWTRDGDRQMRLARDLRAGQVFINNYGAGGGVELPFGGVGASGHGREKGLEALYGFSALKTVAHHHG